MAGITKPLLYWLRFFFLVVTLPWLLLQCRTVLYSAVHVLNLDISRVVGRRPAEMVLLGWVWERFGSGYA